MAGSPTPEKLTFCTSLILETVHLSSQGAAGEEGSPGPAGPRGDPGAPGLPGIPGQGKDGEPVSVTARRFCAHSTKLEFKKTREKGTKKERLTDSQGLGERVHINPWSMEPGKHLLC